MNESTQAILQEIKQQGWYLPNLTLAEGGHGALHKFAYNWKYYELTIWDGSLESSGLIAKNDSIAITYFHEHFNLTDDLEYEIQERKVQYRLVEHGATNG